LAFANPHLQVTHVKINGLQTLSTQQVFEEARVPARTNIFWMAMHQPFAARLAHDPVIDHVSRTIALPHTLVLNVTERQPYAALAVADASGTQAYWVLDRKGVPFRVFPSPPPGIPLLEWQGTAPALALGHPLSDQRLTDAYTLLALVKKSPILAVQKIEVDQYANLCLNSRGNLRILLGQPQALPQKIALAQAALGSQNGFAERVACLDLSCPMQPVYTPRPEASLASSEERPGTYGQ
jgi:cell division protein FtsQ